MNLTKYNPYKKDTAEWHRFNTVANSHLRNLRLSWSKYNETDELTRAKAFQTYLENLHYPNPEDIFEITRSVILKNLNYEIARLHVKTTPPRAKGPKSDSRRDYIAFLKDQFNLETGKPYTKAENADLVLKYLDKTKKQTTSIRHQRIIEAERRKIQDKYWYHQTQKRIKNINVEPTQRIFTPEFNELRTTIRESDKVCRYCMSAPALSVDHVIPLSRGGGNNPSNLVGACLKCNRVKSNLTPKEAGMKLHIPLRFFDYT